MRGPLLGELPPAVAVDLAVVLRTLRPARVAATSLEWQRDTSARRSSVRSSKSMTHRDADASGRELRSSPLRYGNEHLALRGSSAIHASRFRGLEDEAHAVDVAALEGNARVLAQAGLGCPSTRRGFKQSEISGNRDTVADLREPRRPPAPSVPQTAANSRFALAAGQARLWIARVIVKPARDQPSRPTSRVSPCAIVLVAIRPKRPAVVARARSAQEEVGDQVGAALTARRRARSTNQSRIVRPSRR